MTTYAQPAARPTFNIGRIIGRGFSILGARFWPLLGLCLIGFLANILLSIIQGVLTSTMRLPPSSPLYIGLGFLGLGLGVFQFGFIWGAVTWAGVTHIDGRPASFGECLAHGLKTLLPLIALFVLSFLAIGVAYVFLIIPAIILSLVWSVTAQSLTVEGIGVFDAFNRSATLTRDNRFAIFGLNLLVGLINFAVLGGLLMAFGGAMAALGATTTAGGDGQGNLVGGLAIVAVGLIAYVVVSTGLLLANACIQTSLYIELRYIKEGSSTAEVFA